jgi:uncharacterized protein
METGVTFLSDGLQLEGLLNLNSGELGAVVLHPHPLYGGDMHNSVVHTITAVFQKKGYTTLRFNFRGAGASEGQYDEGAGETTDIISALSFLRDQGIRRVDLAGYSFGTWVMAKVPVDPTWMGRLIMISPPVAFMDMPSSLHLPNLDLVITGELDDIAPPEMVKKRLPFWNPTAKFEVIRGADHFYGAKTGKLEEILSIHL